MEEACLPAHTNSLQPTALRVSYNDTPELGQQARSAQHRSARAASTSGQFHKGSGTTNRACVKTACRPPDDANTAKLSA